MTPDQINALLAERDSLRAIARAALFMRRKYCAEDGNLCANCQWFDTCDAISAHKQKYGPIGDE